jgi:hypothetical protein
MTPPPSYDPGDGARLKRFAVLRGRAAPQQSVGCGVRSMFGVIVRAHYESTIKKETRLSTLIFRILDVEIIASLRAWY